MDLRTFHGNVFGKLQGKIYVFEPTWDSFRPITKVAWNGSVFAIIDSKFKNNIFCPNYGFETEEQKKLCRKLAEETELGNAPELKNPTDFWRWCGEKEVSWWRDRPVARVRQRNSPNPLRRSRAGWGEWS